MGDDAILALLPLRENSADTVSTGVSSKLRTYVGAVVSKWANIEQYGERAECTGLFRAP